MTLGSRSVSSVLLALALTVLRGATILDTPYQGVTHIIRTETAPRSLHMHIVEVDLTAPGIAFQLTPPGGTRETIRQTTLDYLNQTNAQVAVNAHFFLPFPSRDLNASVIGLAASGGQVYSAFETPSQSYALVADAPAINIDRRNRAGVVHRDPAFADGRHVVERVTLWNAFAGSAQIITGGVETIPQYRDAQFPAGLLTPGGPGAYSNRDSWYNRLNARTVIGLTRDRKTLVIFTVDARGGSLGMRVGEVADLLIRDYGVCDALNMDGGGSTTLAIQDPDTHLGSLSNVSSDNPKGRAVASNLAVFARPAPVPLR